jgi:transposase
LGFQKYQKGGGVMRRYYLGIDWADRVHDVCVSDEVGEKIVERKVAESVEGLAEFGLWLDERRAEGIELWAAIEKPEGRIVDFLLDHGVLVYPINPKALDRARDRFRQSGSKSDPFDAWVLCEFVRTDHLHLRPLRPNTEQAQELKIMARDHHRLVRQKTRLLHQLKVTLKEYYVRPLDLFGDLDTQIALDFLKEYPTPEALGALSYKRWSRFARVHHLSEGRKSELWEGLRRPQLPIPEHVVRAKAQLVEVLVEQLESLVKAVDKYGKEVQRFFASMPVAELAKELPGGRSGTIVPTLWACLGDAQGRWESFKHLQAHAGAVPVTKRSGKGQVVHFRYACNKEIRYAVHWLAFISLRQSEWANAYYRSQRVRGHGHHRALRALGAKWLKILFVMWRDHVPYDEEYHLANMTRHHMRQAA